MNDARLEKVILSFPQVAPRLAIAGLVLGISKFIPMVIFVPRGMRTKMLSKGSHFWGHAEEKTACLKKYLETFMYHETKNIWENDKRSFYSTLSSR